MASDFRGILALISGLAGIVLVLLAGRMVMSKERRSSRRTRASVVAMYGVLFSVAGMVLWARKGVDPDVAQRRRPEPSHPVASAAPVETAVVDTVSPVPIIEPRQSAAMMPDSIRPTEELRQEPARAYQATDSAVAGGEASPDQRAVDSPDDGPGLGANGMQFPGIAFEPNSAELTSESKASLRTLALELKRQPELKVDIRAHVGRLGPEANNFALAQTRASAVRDFLVVQGVAASRLTAQGFGSPSLSKGPIAFVVHR